MSTYVQGTEWTIAKSLAGGVIISASTVLMMVLRGKVAGLSGIFSGFLSYGDEDWVWKSAFTAGFVGCVAAANVIFPGLYQLNDNGHSVFKYCVGGFLVGFGARLSNGCTSGHGICGLSRFSRRSLVAVLTFMTTAATVATSLELNGSLLTVMTSSDQSDNKSAVIIGSLALVVGTISLVTSIRNHDMNEFLVAAPLGALFAVGLTVSGMANPLKVLSFLVLRLSTWDPSLACVMMGAIPVTAIGFRYATKRGTPLLANRLCMPKATVIDLPLVLGAWLFGVGWGMVGLCPGPSIVLASAGVRNVWMFHVPSMLSGMIIAKQLVVRMKP